MFISVIFERLARKGRSSFGKIITHSEVSMIESIYGQNGKVVLSPSGTLIELFDIRFEFWRYLKIKTSCLIICDKWMTNSKIKGTKEYYEQMNKFWKLRWNELVKRFVAFKNSVELCCFRIRRWYENSAKIKWSIFFVKSFVGFEFRDGTKIPLKWLRQRFCSFCSFWK